MKLIITFLSLSFFALIFFAFNTELSFKPGDNDTPAYETIKKNFWDSYQSYQSELKNNRFAKPPVDPTGTFDVDQNGYFNLKQNGNNRTNVIFPSPLVQGDLVSSLVFSQSTTTYTTIVGGAGTVFVTSGCDDSYYGSLPIGFTFTYNGIPYTVVGLSCNGHMCMGTTGAYGYTPICSGGYPNIISPFANDLYGLAAGNGIYYQTSGSSPNRIFTAEWYHWGFYSAGLNEMNFQVKLYENTSAVQFVYQPQTPSTTASYGGMTVGLMGATNADYNIRTTASNWSSTTAGSSACVYCTYSSSSYPANGLTFTWAPPAPPPVPTLVRPLNHSVGRPLVDTLQWTASSGATNYNLQIAIDSLFATIVYSDTTLTGTAYQIGTFTPLTNWWWRVRAKNAIGWSAFTTQWTFRTMGPASQVTLFTPANNAVNQPITNLLFNWSHAIDQTGPLTVSNYWYALYADTTQSPLVVDSTLTDTTKTVSGLLNNTNYWWKVRAKNNVSYGPFSTYFKFTTVVAAPAAPTNIAPANHSIVYTPTPLLDWSSVAGATTYRVQLSTDSTFTTVLRDSTVTVDSLRLPTLLNNTKYFWHVRAQNAGGNSSYTAIWDFTTNLSGVVQYSNEIPKVFRLYNNYPNPFNPVSTIKFDIPKTTDVKLIIYNAIGQEISILLNSRFEPGSYSIQWNGFNNPSGVYFYKITAGDFTDIHKMVLIK